jgi:hypothetical protein
MIIRIACRNMSTPATALSYDALLERYQASEHANKKLSKTLEVYKERTVNIAALVDKYKHLDQKHQDLREDHASVSKQLADTQKALDTAKAKSSEKTAEITPLKAKLRREVAAKDALAAQLEEAECKSRAAEKALKAEQNQAAELRKEREALEAARLDTLRPHNASHGEFETLREEVVELKAAVQASRSCNHEEEILDLRRTINAIASQSFTHKLPAVQASAPSTDSDGTCLPTQVQNVLNSLRMQQTAINAELACWRRFFGAMADGAANLGATPAAALEHNGAPTSSCTPTNPLPCRSSSALLGDCGEAWEAQQVGTLSRRAMRVHGREAGCKHRASMQSSTATAAVATPTGCRPGGHKRRLAVREDDRERAERAPDPCQSFGSGDSEDDSPVLPLPQRHCAVKPTPAQHGTAPVKIRALPASAAKPSPPPLHDNKMAARVHTFAAARGNDSGNANAEAARGARRAMQARQQSAVQKVPQMELRVEDAPLPRRQFRRSETTTRKAPSLRLMQLGSGKVKSTAVAGSGFFFQSAEEVARWRRIQSDHPEWDSERQGPSTPLTPGATASPAATPCHPLPTAEELDVCAPSVESLFGSEDDPGLARSPVIVSGARDTDQQAACCSLHDRGDAIQRTTGTAGLGAEHTDEHELSSCRVSEVAPLIVAQLQRHAQIRRGVPSMPGNGDVTVTCWDEPKTALGVCGKVQGCIDAARQGASPPAVSAALARLLNAGIDVHDVGQSAEVISNCIADAVTARALPWSDVAAQLQQGCVDALDGSQPLGAMSCALLPVSTSGSIGLELELVVAAVLSLHNPTVMAAVAKGVEHIAVARTGYEDQVVAAALAGISVVLDAHAAQLQGSEHTLQAAERRFAKVRDRGAAWQLGAALGELSDVHSCSPLSHVWAVTGSTNLQPLEAMRSAVCCAMSQCFCAAQKDSSAQNDSSARVAWTAILNVGTKSWGWPMSVGAGAVASVAHASVASLERAVTHEKGEGSRHAAQWTAEQQLNDLLELCNGSSVHTQHANNDAEHASVDSSATSGSSDDESSATGTSVPGSPQLSACHLAALHLFLQHVGSALRIAAAVSDWQFVADVLVEGIVWPALERLAVRAKAGTTHADMARLAMCSLSGVCEDLLVHTEARSSGSAASFVADMRDALAFMG